MSTTGAKLPSTGTSIAEDIYNDVDWLNQSWIIACDSISSTCQLASSGNYSYILYAKEFDFSVIPDDATISGVICTINVYASVASSIVGYVAQLTNNLGAREGTNQFSPPVDISDTATDIVKGSSSDLWGCVLTPAWVKDKDFGVGFSFVTNYNTRTVYVDCVKLEVYYTGGTVSGTMVTSSRAYDSRSIRPSQRRPFSRKI
jgi:hypothetical protein